MILWVGANHESFKPFTPDSEFNVVLAERTEEGTDRDSTNGSGKTLLLEIVHFAFGSDAQRSPVMDPHLSGWRFSVDFAWAGSSTARRAPLTSLRAYTLRATSTGGLIRRAATRTPGCSRIQSRTGPKC